MLGAFKDGAKCLCRKTVSFRLFGGNIRREVCRVFWCCRLVAEPFPACYLLFCSSQERGNSKRADEATK